MPGSGFGDDEETGEHRNLKAGVYTSHRRSFRVGEVISENRRKPLDVGTEAHSKPLSVAITLKSTLVRWRRAHEQVVHLVGPYICGVDRTRDERESSKDCQ